MIIGCPKNAKHIRIKTIPVLLHRCTIIAIVKRHNNRTATYKRNLGLMIRIYGSPCSKYKYTHTRFILPLVVSAAAAALLETRALRSFFLQSLAIARQLPWEGRREKISLCGKEEKWSVCPAREERKGDPERENGWVVMRWGKHLLTLK